MLSMTYGVAAAMSSATTQTLPPCRGASSTARSASMVDGN
jgi:hypothetical protein